ncbi:hypothetical protein B0H13DRAFT_1889317 [Mycena leptocephala]|nr:hypothetical protein B0H13DRAFT_1889317 [Mycena leptocephala]
MQAATPEADDLLRRNGARVPSPCICNIASPSVVKREGKSCEAPSTRTGEGGPTTGPGEARMPTKWQRSSAGEAALGAAERWEKRRQGAGSVRTGRTRGGSASDGVRGVGPCWRPGRARIVAQTAKGAMPMLVKWRAAADYRTVPVPAMRAHIRLDGGRQRAWYGGGSGEAAWTTRSSPSGAAFMLDARRGSVVGSEDWTCERARPGTAPEAKGNQGERVRGWEEEDDGQHVRGAANVQRVVGGKGELIHHPPCDAAAASKNAGLSKAFLANSTRVPQAAISPGKLEYGGLTDEDASSARPDFDGPTAKPKRVNDVWVYCVQVLPLTGVCGDLMYQSIPVKPKEKPDGKAKQPKKKKNRHSLDVA